MNSWRTLSIRNMTILIKDGTHGSHQESTGGVPLLSAKDINNGKIIFNNNPRLISQDEFNSIHKSYKIMNDDILLTIVGSLGRVSLVTDYENNYTFQRSVAILRFKDEINSRFIYYLLSGYEFQKELMKRESKGAQGGVYLGEIAKIKMTLPPKPEQERIVSVLEIWDEYLEKLDRKIALKKKLKEGLMQQLLTGKKRLPGFSGVWQTKSLSNAIIESRTKDIENNPSKRLTVRLHLKGVQKRIVRGTESIDSTQYYIRRTGQLIYGKQNIFRGAIGIVPEIYDGYASSQDIPAFDVLPEYNAKFIFYVLSSENYYRWLENFATGSGSKRLHVLEFQKLKILFPLKAEQDEIVRLVSCIEREVDCMLSKQNSVQDQKKYLLENLTTGKIRTPENLTLKRSL